MLHDIVVDTNVFVHASNPANEHFSSSVQFVTALSAASALLCVDEGFDVAESKNRSLIGGEYNERLVSGMLGYAVVATLAASGRIKQVTKSVPNAVRHRVKRLVPRNPRDRTFVHVAINSSDRTLVSHDLGDFSNGVRRELRKQCDVHVQLAQDVTASLS